MIRLIVIALLMFSSGFSPVLPAQQAEGESAAVVEPVEKGPPDALNRGNPRGSILGYLQACSSFDFEKAAEYLDLRGLPEEVSELGGHELARQLNHVLSRAVWLDDYSVSDSPEGLKGDGLPDYRDELVRIRTREGARCNQPGGSWLRGSKSRQDTNSRKKPKEIGASLRGSKEPLLTTSK